MRDHDILFLHGLKPPHTDFQLIRAISSRHGSPHMTFVGIFHPFVGIFQFILRKLTFVGIFNLFVGIFHPFVGTFNTRPF